MTSQVEVAEVAGYFTQWDDDKRQNMGVHTKEAIYHRWSFRQ